MNRAALPLRLIACSVALVLLAGCFGGSRTRVGPDSRYSNMLHGRFYRAWVQPKAITAPPGKISVPVDVQIDQSGRVTRFRIAKSSGYPAIDESIMAVSRKVTQVDAPPATTRRGLFRLRIFFDLDVR
ncbi:hypothetical protein BH20VER2_BH20VER2_14620 [soil metagenome]